MISYNESYVRESKINGEATENEKYRKKDEDLVKIVQPLVDWYRENKRDLPWRHNPDAYRVWISEIMLQQTRVEAVKGYYDRFLKALPTVRISQKQKRINS